MVKKLLAKVLEDLKASFFPQDLQDLADWDHTDLKIKDRLLMELHWLKPQIPRRNI